VCVRRARSAVGPMRHRAHSFIETRASSPGPVHHRDRRRADSSDLTGSIPIHSRLLLSRPGAFRWEFVRVSCYLRAMVTNLQKLDVAASGVSRLAFDALANISRRRGLRTSRVHHWLARRGYQSLHYSWTEVRPGTWMELSPSLFIDRIILVQGEYDCMLHRVLDRLIVPGMTCLDVGANIGDVTLYMARLLNTSGHVFAFEPVPHVYERISKHVIRSGLAERVSVLPIALSNQNGRADIAFASQEVENQGMASLVNRSNSVVDSHTQIQTATLDSFVKANQVPSIGFIKIDIQGAELLFLEGASQTIEESRPVIAIEVSPEDLAKAGHSPPDIFTFFAKRDYRAFDCVSGAHVEIDAAQVDSHWISQNTLFVPHEQVERVIAALA
jgi:FkbM family methyltransferase